MAIGKLTKDCLNIIFLLDTSGSMIGSRIDQLNYAMPEALQALKKVAISEEVDAFVRIIEFNSTAAWIMGTDSAGVSIEDAANAWKNLTARGGTDTAGAIKLSLDALHTSFLGTRNYLPVVILLTDGESNNFAETQNATELLKKALAGNTGKEKVMRVAVGVQDYKESELVAFASLGTIDDGTGEPRTNVPLVFKVDNIGDLANILKSVAVSSLYSAMGGNNGEEEFVVDLTPEGKDPNAGTDTWVD